MKRRNVQLAFIGEGSTTTEPVDDLVMGDEAVELTVQGGALTVVVPAGTPDERIFEAASVVGGELVLENGVRLSFEIKGEAIGGLFSAAPAGMQDEFHEGLSSLPNTPAV